MVSNLLIGEKHNLKFCIEKSDVNFIVIVDEFHRNYDTIAYNELMKLFNPKIILGVTATPNAKQSKINRRYTVSTSKVKEEGMIKIGTIFNENLTKITINDDKDITETILDLAIKKREELEFMYRAENSNIIPLCLIQLPNKTIDPNMKENIVNYLSQYDINGINFKENEDFTIWLSEEKDNKIIQNMNNNKIKFLIFKQAVAIGWDCPRAHILVKFRPMKKDLEAFDLQTIGRVLRTPEHKHYKNQILNFAYIYAEDEKISFDSDVNEAFDGKTPLYKNLKIKNAESLLLTQNYDEKFPDNKFIREKLIDNLDKYCLSNKKDLSYKTQNIATLLIDTENLDNLGLLKSQQEEINKSRKTLRNQYLKFVNTLNKFNLITENNFKIVFKRHFLKIDNNITGSNAEEIEFSFIEMCLSYKDSIIQAFNETNKNRNTGTLRITKDFKEFIFDKSPKYQEPCGEYGKKNIYIPRVDTGYSQPEKTFIDILDKNTNVLAWCKNKDKGGNSLCINYQTATQNKGKTILIDNPTYPDFIVFFKNGEIGIYEIKDLDKLEDVNKDKAIGISNYLKLLKIKNNNKTFYGGLIYINQTTNTIENKNDFIEL